MTTEPKPAQGDAVKSQVDRDVLADAVTALAGYAMAFGRIDRTACLHPDLTTPESDSDHTVMLGWVAPAIADRHFPDLNGGLVAQFALIHDAVEVFAGDTQTLRIDDDGRTAKAAREHAAAGRWRAEFRDVLPWMPRMIDRYERQREREARFVRALDKILPKFVHAHNSAADLAQFGMTATELEDTLSRQHTDMESYAAEFGVLMDLHTEMSARVVATLRARETEHAA